MGLPIIMEENRQKEVEKGAGGGIETLPNYEKCSGTQHENVENQELFSCFFNAITLYCGHIKKRTNEHCRC